MALPIIITHLNFEGSGHYLAPCIEITAHYNPDSTLYVITADEGVKQEVERIRKPNIRVVMAERSLFDDFDKITLPYFNDRPEFYAMCYSRHLAIQHLGECGDLHDIHATPFVFVDSDTAVFAPVDSIFATDHEVPCVKSYDPSSTNFCYWTWADFSRFCDTDNILTYLRENHALTYLRENNLSPFPGHDMAYLGWAVKNRVINHFLLRSLSSYPYELIDTIRIFSFTYGLYAGLAESDFDWRMEKDRLIQHPKGHWADVAFIKRFGQEDFLRKLLKTETDDRFGCRFRINSAFVNECCAIRQDAWGHQIDGQDMMGRRLQNQFRDDDPVIGMIHFQDVAKALVRDYHALWRAECDESSDQSIASS